MSSSLPAKFTRYMKHYVNTPLDAWLFPHVSLWLAAVISAVVMAFWIAASAISFDFGDAWKVNVFSGLLLLVGFRYVKMHPPVSAICFTAAYMLLIGQVLRPLTYLGTAAAFPLIDPWLASFDQAIGFDWVAHVAWVNSTPWALNTLKTIYYAILQTMMITVGLLIVLQRFERLREITLLTSLMTLSGVVFCTFLPAIGAYAWYQPAPELISNISASYGRYHLEHFNGLRDGSLTAFDLNKTIGIITFPSFHTVVPFMCAWAFRGSKLAWLAIPPCALMILSTLSIGGHHLADVVAALAMCVLACWLYSKWKGRSAPQEHPHSLVAAE